MKLIKAREEFVLLIGTNEKESVEHLEEKKVQILKDKLTEILVEIDNDIYSVKKEFRLSYAAIIAIEILVLFVIASNYIMAKSYVTGLYFTEGIFKYPISRIVILLILTIVSFFITRKFE